MEELFLLLLPLQLHVSAAGTHETMVVVAVF
jgi:hypothetical protein